MTNQVNITMIQASFNGGFTLEDTSCFTFDQMAHYKLVGLLIYSIICSIIEALICFLSIDRSNIHVGVSNSQLIHSPNLPRVQMGNNTISFYSLALEKLRDRYSYYVSVYSTRPICQKRNFYSSFSTYEKYSNRSYDYFVSSLNPSFEILVPDFLSLRTKVERVSNTTPVHNQTQDTPMYTWNESFLVDVNNETLPLIINFKSVDHKGITSLLGFISFSLYTLDLTKSSSYLVKLPLQHGNGHVYLQISSNSENSGTQLQLLDNVQSTDLTNYPTGYDMGRFPRSLESVRRGFFTNEESAYFDTIFDPITIEEIYKIGNTGDLILFSGNELASFVVLSTYQTSWSHVGMLLRNPPVELLVEYNVDPKYYINKNETLFYVDIDDSYSSNRKGGGIQIIDVNLILMQSFTNDKNSLISYRKLVSNHYPLDYTDLYKFISDSKSARYESNFLESIRSCSRTNTEINENDMFCSEFVGACLKKLKLMPNSVRTNNMSTLDLSSEMNFIHAILLKAAFYEREKRIKN